MAYVAVFQNKIIFIFLDLYINVSAGSAPPCMK